jgi:hypothetical protein
MFMDNDFLPRFSYRKYPGLGAGDLLPVVFCCLLAAVMVSTSCLGLATPLPPEDVNPIDDTIPEYHHVIPLGVLAYELRPPKRPFYLMAASVGSDFDGWKVLGSGYHKYIVDREGARVSQYPRRLLFRVSAGARDQALIGHYRDPITSRCKLNELLVGLRFRLKLFRGVHARALQPQMVRQVGVPEDIPFEERVYVVGFDLNGAPLSDRVVLEVLSPAGECIGKFHFDLY